MAALVYLYLTLTPTLIPPPSSEFSSVAQLILGDFCLYLSLCKNRRLESGATLTLIVDRFSKEAEAKWALVTQHLKM